MTESNGVIIPATTTTTTVYKFWDPPIAIPTSMSTPAPPTKVYTFPDLAFPDPTPTTQPQAHKRGRVTEVEVEVRSRSPVDGDSTLEDISEIMERLKEATFNNPHPGHDYTDADRAAMEDLRWSSPEAVRGEQKGKRGSSTGVGVAVAAAGARSGVYVRTATYKNAAAAGGKIGFAVGGLLVVGSLAWLLL